MSIASPFALRLRALLQRDTLACHQLGAMYATGEVLQKNEKAAVRWYGRGARRGDPESQYDLGFMLLLGEGTEANPEAGVHWLSLAALGGHLGAARLLADLYSTGKSGVPRNAVEAEKWEMTAERLRHDA
jgi:TPR repeat protein